jgi:hypothetical protein
MAKNETAVRVWFFGTPERDDLGNEWPGLDIDEQTKIGHPDKIWEHFHDFLSAIFTAAGFKARPPHAVANVSHLIGLLSRLGREITAEAIASRIDAVLDEVPIPVEVVAEILDELRASGEFERIVAANQPARDEPESGEPEPVEETNAEIDAAKQAEQAEAAKQAEAEQKRQEQAERKKAQDRRNHLVDFNQFGRHDIDKLTHPDWEKEPDPIKAERKAIEQLDRDLRWLEGDLLCGSLNLPALIRGLRKDETARVEVLERLETWACFIAALRSKLTTTPTPEPDHKESGQPADPAPAESPITAETQSADPAITPQSAEPAETAASLNWYEKQSDDGKFAFHEATGRGASYMITIRLARLENVADKNPWELCIFKHGDRSGGAFAVADYAGAYSTLELAQAAARRAHCERADPAITPPRVSAPVNTDTTPISPEQEKKMLAVLRKIHSRGGLPKSAFIAKGIQTALVKDRLIRVERRGGRRVITKRGREWANQRLTEEELQALLAIQDNPAADDLGVFMLIQKLEWRGLIEGMRRDRHLTERGRELLAKYTTPAAKAESATVNGTQHLNASEERAP